MSLDSDPFRYFRLEAQELLEQLTRGLLSVEEGSGDAQAVPRLFRFAHTLKGAARVVGQVKMAEMAHAVEDALAEYRDGGEPLPADSVPEFLLLVRRMGEELAKLDAPAESPPASTGHPEGAPPANPAKSPPVLSSGQGDEVVRVELSKLDALLSEIPATRRARVC